MPGGEGTRKEQIVGRGAQARGELEARESGSWGAGAWVNWASLLGAGGED